MLRRSLANTPMAHEKGLQILFCSQLRAQNVTIGEISSSRLLDNNLEKLCESKWGEMLASAEAQGKKLWDSEVYRFESASVRNTLLSLKVSVISFSVRLAMNSYTMLIKSLGIKYAPLGMYTSCFMETSDGVFLFIEKSNKYFTTKRISFVGGVLSKTEKKLLVGDDLFNEVLKEIKEEIGIDSIDIKEHILRCGYITENYNICLLFEVTLNKSFEEVGRNFKDKTDDEATRLIGVKKSELATFMETLEKKDAVKFKILDLVRIDINDL